MWHCGPPSPSKHLCRTGVNGVVARVAGKGRGEGRAAQQITRHHQTQDLWPCEDASGQIGKFHLKRNVLGWFLNHMFFLFGWWEQTCGTHVGVTWSRSTKPIYLYHIYFWYIMLYIMLYIVICICIHINPCFHYPHDKVSKTSPIVLVSCRHAHVLLAKRFKVRSLNLWKCWQCLERTSYWVLQNLAKLSMNYFRQTGIYDGME